MAKQIKVREDNYFAVQGWMVTELKLKGKAQYFRYYEEYKIDYDFQTAKVRVKTEDGIDQWIKVRLCFGCDLAISEKEQDKGDYFVLMVIGVDADHNVYVLDYVKERLTFNTQLKEVLEKLEADKERDRQSTDPYSMQNVTEDSNNLFPNLNAQNSPQEALNAQGATIPQPEQ